MLKIDLILKKSFYLLLCGGLVIVALLPSPAKADSFVIEDIRIEGLRRFSPGIIFSRLPLGIGDTFADEQAVELIQSLYETGYFREVEVLRDENILVVKVEENPTIAEVTVSGAAELPDDALTGMLDSAGISQAKVFNQSVIEEATRAIEEAYIERNFYHAKVEAVISPLPRNRVAILFDVDEGVEAAIRSIRIIGNEEYTTWRLRRDMRLEPRSPLNFFTDNYRYSDQRLQSDLSRIRTRYLQAGFLRFEVESRQVEISQDKRHIDIIIRISEGQQYAISDIRFQLAPGAESPVDLETFRPYIEQDAGDIYSGRLAGNVEVEIRNYLGDLGYVEAEVGQEANINDEDATVEIVYLVNPKQRFYVRNINIVGNEITADRVIRRELLQFERALYSRNLVNRSSSRVRRLGYFNRVQIEPVAVEGETALVDLLVTVEERNTGEISLGAGFSSDGGISYNAGFSNRNIFGSGNDFEINFSKSEDDLRFDFELNEHYYTKDGVTRHMALSFGESDAGEDSSNYSIDGYKGEFGFDYPFTDDGKYNVYLAYEQVDIKSVENTVIYQPFIDKHGRNFNSLLLESGLTYDTRNAFSTPTEGHRVEVRAEVALPLLELSYYHLDYQHDYYYTARELPTDPVLHIRTGAGYGDAYGGGVYPFYRRYYLGGTNTLRGFASNSIGYTTDAAGDAIGGKSRLYASAELSADTEFFEEQQIFLVPFIDGGAVGEDIGLGSFRSSWGVELRWVSPVGPLRFAYVEILKSKPSDNVENFQFAISTF